MFEVHTYSEDIAEVQQARLDFLQSDFHGIGHIAHARLQSGQGIIQGLRQEGVKMP